MTVREKMKKSDEDMTEGISALVLKTMIECGILAGDINFEEVENQVKNWLDNSNVE